MTLDQKIIDRQATIGVIGLGYVGLPLAVAFANKGFRVIGIDSDDTKVEAIRTGRSYIRDVASSELARLVGLAPGGSDGRASQLNGAAPAEERAGTSRGLLRAMTGYEALRECDALFICVPTPFDAFKTPDLSYVLAATEGIATELRRGHLVVLQSTTFPGTTEEVVQPILERNGMRAGRDFHLAFSPERIDPGNRNWTVENLPKVVGGVTEEDGQLAADLLRQIHPEVHLVSSPRAAEMTKLLENIFRSVNIALVNELALLAERMNLNIWEVIDAAATKPFGYMPFYPGPGVGGHCIPVDPYYLSWKAREYDFAMRFIELAAETNQRMPYHVVELIGHALGQSGVGMKGAKIMLLGAAFKAGVDDARNSPSGRVMELLLDRGAVLSYHDPYVAQYEVQRSAFYSGEPRTLRSTQLTQESLADQDCVVVMVGHRDVDYELVLHHAPVIVDTANVMPSIEALEDKVVRLGSGANRSTTGARPLELASTLT
jgi:UDP-N-acetyl-D-glucosamine dehydrogenase